MAVARRNLLVIPINVLMINPVLRRTFYNNQRFIFLVTMKQK